jgi:hypothetical protein
MSTLSPSSYVTFEAFLEAEEKSDMRHEWLDGVVYDMSRGTPEHARLWLSNAAMRGDADSPARREPQDLQTRGLDRSFHRPHPLRTRTRACPAPP